MVISYSDDWKLALCDGYKFRRDAKTGYFLSTRNTDAGKRERLHCYVWRHYNGEIPEGCHIHHVDEDKKNNSIENLACVDGVSHSKYHSGKQAKENYAAMCRNLMENAMPRAAEWHHSDVGRAWHSAHAKETIKNLKEIPYKCECCGKVFYKKPLGRVRFCSNNCKTKARAQSGVDNETRRCAVCGGEFVANKYAQTKCCSISCGDKLRWDSRYKKSGERGGIQHGG